MATPARDLLTLIMGVARLIRTEADRRARAHGMSRAQWTVLIHLRRRPGLVQKELADLLEVEPITAARILDRLQARGMIERRPDPADRRCWRLHLTADAEPLLADIETQLADLASIATAGAGAEGLESAFDTLSLMRDALARSGEAPRARAVAGGRIAALPAAAEKVA